MTNKKGGTVDTLEEDTQLLKMTGFISFDKDTILISIQLKNVELQAPL